MKTTPLSEYFLAQRTKAVITSIALLLFSGVAFGQTDFRDGYIITNNLDTIKGLIDYRGEARNMKTCTYKPTGNGTQTTYGANQIKGYRFSKEGRYFVSRYLSAKDVKDTVFLEYLVNGLSDLYFHQNNKGFAAYFIEGPNGDLLELQKLNDQIVDIDGTNYMKEDNKYVGLLTYAFADCPELKKEIQYIELNHKSLINITKKYHDYKCTDEACIVYEKKLQVVRVSFNPLVGYSWSNVAFENDYLESFDFTTSRSFIMGVDINITMPRANEKLSLLVGSHINKDYFYGTEREDNTLTYTDYYYCHLYRWKWANSLSLKYTYPKGRYRPIAFAGVQINSIVSEDGTLVKEHKSMLSVTTQEAKIETTFKATSGLLGGIGVEFPAIDNRRGFAYLSYSMGSATNEFGYSERNLSIAITTGLSF